MDEKNEILASISAAIACNCIPCFEHLYLTAKNAGICDTNLNHAIAIGERVKSGAAIAVKGTVDAIQKGEISKDELGNGACACECG